MGARQHVCSGSRHVCTYSRRAQLLTQPPTQQSHSPAAARRPRRATLVSVGANCRLLSAYHKLTGEKVAIKAIAKKRDPDAAARQHFRVLKVRGLSPAQHGM